MNRQSLLHDIRDGVAILALDGPAPSMPRSRLDVTIRKEMTRGNLKRIAGLRRRVS
jgi:hypothetical protein